MLTTAFTELVGCTAPVQLAPMGGICTPALVAAVNDAGGMGMIGVAGVPPQAIDSVLEPVDAATEGPWGVNFLTPLLETREPVEVVAGRVKVVDFYHSEPDATLVDIVHQGGSLAGWQVGSVESARAAVDAGCDLLIARGVEGGGRMYGDQSLLPLLDQILEAVDAPVLAAGGIATGRGLAAMLAAGAAGVRMGTRFVATAESGAHPDYKQAIVGAKASDTVLTTAFSVMWPGGPEPHRVLSSAVRAAEALDDETVGETQLGPERVALPRFAAPPPFAATTGRIDAMALYAGESVEGIHAIEPASDVVRRVVEEAERLLSR